MPTHISLLLTWLWRDDHLIRQAIKIKVQTLLDNNISLSIEEITREDLYKLEATKYYQNYNAKIVEIEEIQNIEEI
jgi:hypothetical protein